MPQLQIEWFPTQIFWLVVTFTLLYFALSRVALPRIAEVLNARESRIAADLERAQRLKTEAETVRAQYEKALSEARAKAQALLRETQEELAQVSSRREAEVGQRLAAETKAAEARIAKAKEDAIGGLRQVVTETTASAAERLAGGGFADKDVAAAVAAAMKGNS
jgi:F-type H+-transporting ATPase subunit b